jgi:hypothetical protein
VEPWANIELSPADPEVKRIDDLEVNLGEVPENVRQIRDLITGFEVCHFKYRKHIEYILDSIHSLKPNISLREIGLNHIRHGENVWRHDKSGRSLKGLQYIQALKYWLGVDAENIDKATYDPELNRSVSDWLGSKNPEKERLVRLLIARLTWDWESYEKYRRGKEGDELEFQVCRIDICHYNFPLNMDVMIRAIGQMIPVGQFEGCGSCDPEIKSIAEKEILRLNKMVESIIEEGPSDKGQNVRAWLLSSLAKTLKEQSGSSIPVHIFNQKIKS